MRILEIFFLKAFFKKTLSSRIIIEGNSTFKLHLLPTKIRLLDRNDSIFSVIINGTHIVPITYSTAIKIFCFMNEVNKQSLQTISQKVLDRIIQKSSRKIKLLEPKTTLEDIKKDVSTIISELCSIASTGKTTDLGDRIPLDYYLKTIIKPYQMDLILNSTRNDGQFNCSNRQIHCYALNISRSDDSPELSTNEWKEAISILEKYGIPSITFTGGEATLRPDLPELIRSAKWFYTRLCTNGINLTKKLCDALKASYLDSIQITLYSANANTHNRLFNSNTFDKTWNGIINALRAGLHVCVHTPLCSFNKDEYLDTLKKLHEIGVKEVSCSGFIIPKNPNSKNTTNTQLSENEMYELLKIAKSYCEKNKMMFTFTSPGWIRANKLFGIGIEAPRCKACLISMGIMPNGDIIPCRSWITKADSMGNILRTPLEIAWTNYNCAAIRETIFKRPERCPYSYTYR